MFLYPKQKRAVVERTPLATKLPSSINFLEGLRDCDTDWVEQGKDAYFEGQRVEKYKIIPESPFSGGMDVLVFVDPKTRLPVRIESSVNDVYLHVLGGPLSVVSNNFSYDQLDSTLFATVPPEGYRVDGAMDSASRAVEPTTD